MGNTKKQHFDSNIENEHNLKNDLVSKKLQVKQIKTYT